MTTLRQKQDRGGGGGKVYVALCRRLLTFEKREESARKMEKVRNGVTTRDGKERGRDIGQKEGENGLCCTRMANAPRDTKGNLILVIKRKDWRICTARQIRKIRKFLHDHGW